MVQRQIKSVLYGLAAIVIAGSAGVFLAKEYGKLKYEQGIMDNLPSHIGIDKRRESCTVYTPKQISVPMVRVTDNEQYIYYQVKYQEEN